jgi:hypothetical protein
MDWALTTWSRRTSWFQSAPSFSYSGEGLAGAVLPLEGAWRHHLSAALLLRSLCSRRLCLFPLTATTIACSVVTPAAAALKLLLWCDTTLWRCPSTQATHLGVHGRRNARCGRIAGSVCTEAVLLEQTNQKVKGRVRCRCETSSLVRFDFLCRKLIAGNGKCCLKLKLGNVLSPTRFCCWERSWLFRLSILLLLRDYPIRDLVLYQKNFVEWLSVSWTQKCWGRFGWRSLRFGRGIISAEALRDWGVVPCPSWTLSWHLPYIWGKAQKTPVTLAE